MLCEKECAKEATAYENQEKIVDHGEIVHTVKDSIHNFAVIK